MFKKIFLSIVLFLGIIQPVIAVGYSWLHNKYLIAGACLGATYLSATAYKHYKKPRGPHKQVAVYYASKDPYAALITETVEWPVKVIYANNLIGRFLSSFVNFVGAHVTKKQGETANSTHQPLVQRKIQHYKTFYTAEINMDIFEVPQDGFKSFNEWFTRKLKNPNIDRPLEINDNAVASTADSKLLIIPNIKHDTHITIKEKDFCVESFLQDPKLATEFEGGTMMIFRLAPYDYHRYHFPFNCTVEPEVQIKGNYHSVNPRAFVLGHKPLTKNKRSYQVLTATQAHATKVIMAQIGATAVASIVNDFMVYDKDTHKALFLKNPAMIYPKGSETGYFQFGGSTVVLLFPKDTIAPDAQIVKNSLNGYETAVKVRETIGTWNI